VIWPPVTVFLFFGAWRETISSHDVLPSQGTGIVDSSPGDDVYRLNPPSKPMKQVADKVTKNLARSPSSPIHNPADQNAGIGVPFNIQRTSVSRVRTQYLGPAVASTGLLLLLRGEPKIPQMRIIHDRVPKTLAFRTDDLEKSLHQVLYHAWRPIGALLLS
jgi:hypothetical protein